MEGLLIAEELGRLRRHLDAGRGGWRFPDRHTFVLPLGDGALWLFNRPPDPRLELLEDAPPAAGTHSSFQELLVARAGGDLVAANQHRLDRLVYLEFAAGGGFVETPPVRLVFELTGRNCNLILVDEADVIIGAAREVRSDMNRYRQVARGLTYQPPPPYDKLDPRGAGREELRSLLAGREAKEIPKVLDGIGPRLAKALAADANVSLRQSLEGESLDRVLDALERLIASPANYYRSVLEVADVATLRREERRKEMYGRLEAELRRRIDLVNKRLADLERTEQAATGANELRHTGDLLLAYAADVPQGESETTMTGFEGEPVTLTLNPAKNAAENAQDYFERARKREARAVNARNRRPELQAEAARLEETLARLPGMSDEELAQIAEELTPQRVSERRKGPGIRYEGPHGFTILVGRNARENDQLTFKVARSKDVWLHVQGYHGSHVIVQARNREVPFDTILHAARLAAGHSKASDSENVPVDYTLRKNVWKVKGQPPGAVNFTRQKTVYVTPSRNPVQDRR